MRLLYQALATFLLLHSTLVFAENSNKTETQKNSFILSLSGFSNDQIDRYQKRINENQMSEPGDLIYKILLHYETIQSEQEVLNEKNAQLNQSYGAFMPEISLNATQPLYNKKQIYQPLLYVRLKQPVINALNDYTGLLAAKDNIQISRLTLQQEIQNIFLESVKSIYNYKMVGLQLEIKENSISLTNDRIHYLTKRVSLGKSSESEVLSSKARLERLKAEKESLKAALYKEGEHLMLLAHLEKTPSEIRINSEMNSDMQQTDLFHRVAQRPDTLTSLLIIAREEHNLLKAKGEFLPSIFLQADYYINDNNSINRIQPYNQGNFSINAVASLPLFSGFKNYFKVKEFQSRVQSSKINNELVQKKAKNEIMNNYNAYLSAYNESLSYKSAYEMAQKSYALVQEEYKYGRVTNLEVLSALMEMQDIYSLLVSSQYRYYLARVELEVSLNKSIGEIIATL